MSYCGTHRFVENKGYHKVIYNCPRRSKSEVTQLCPTLWDPMDYSLPGSSVHGILQARILEWVAIPFSRGSSWPRDRTQVFHIAGRCFTIWATREAYYYSHQWLTWRQITVMRYLILKTLMFMKKVLIVYHGGFHAHHSFSFWYPGPHWTVAYYFSD